MRPYTKAVDIWAMTDEAIALLQPGQWVYAGDRSQMGRFLGQGATTVVAWASRHPKGKRYRDYLKKYAQYGREVRNRKEA